MRGQSLLLSLASLAMIVGCSSIAVAQDEVVLFEDSAEYAACETRVCARDISASFDREIVIYHAPGITGANDIYVPNAVGVLEEIVRDCRLGHTLLSYHTDGVASLLFGQAPLSEDQIACIRTYERPGLFLQESSAS